MIKDKITEKMGRWSLDRVQFLLSHIENFIDDESEELRQKAKQFVAQTGLDKIERLIETDPNDPELPRHLLERLATFFDAGVLIQRGLSPENGNWWVTDIFSRGNIFHLELNDQIRANSLIPDLTPLQVNKAQAKTILKTINMDFLAADLETMAYMLKPTPGVALVLLSNLPAPWAASHMEHAHKLVNKAFNY